MKSISLLLFLPFVIKEYRSPILAHPQLFNPNNYPIVDIRHTMWPKAKLPLVRPVHKVHCFTELTDPHFLDPSVVYRLSSADKLASGACLVRVPTRSRASVVRMDTKPESYVSFLAGSSDVYMPLRTAQIHAGQPDRFGPWHIACQRAYLEFRTKPATNGTKWRNESTWSAATEEWVEFQMEPEAEGDLADSQRSDCSAEGVNYADLAIQ